MFETNFPKFKFISPAPAKLNPEYRLTLSFSLTTGVKICLGEKVLIKRLDRIKINGKPIPRDKRKSLEIEKGLDLRIIIFFSFREKKLRRSNFPIELSTKKRVSSVEK